MSVYVNDIMSHIDKDNIRFYSDNKILEALINDKLIKQREMALN